IPRGSARHRVDLLDLTVHLRDPGSARTGHAGLSGTTGIAGAEACSKSGVTITLTVPEDSDGVRLDLFLASVVADRSRSQIQRLIKDESVRVGGRVAKSNQPV